MTCFSSCFPLHRSRRRFAALLALALCLQTAPAWAADAVSAPPNLERLEEQRELYRQALEALGRGNDAAYTALLPRLADYPLLPYLEYAALERPFAKLPEAEAENFLTRHAGTLPARRLQREWLSALAREERWEPLVRHHDPANSGTELTCKALWARLQTGAPEPFEGVPALWNVSWSQPNACDPVFDAWRAAGGLTPDLVWDRLGKTLNAGANRLGRYVAGLMSGPDAALAQLYVEVDSRPERLRESAAFTPDSARVREIVLHGLRRLARVDAGLARNLWKDYAARLDFTGEERVDLQRFIAMRLLLQDQVAEVEAWLSAQPELMSVSLGEWLLRDALGQQDWTRFGQWLDRLPAEVRDSERWLYWEARALEVQGSAGGALQAQALRRTLAEARSWYGFLAADGLGQDYALVDRPVQADASHWQALYALPAVLRAYELYHLGELDEADREWRAALASMPETLVPAAGRLADGWGWHRNGIQSLIQAQYWDDLSVRFPLAHAEAVDQHARELGLSPTLLYAVARQESAFNPRARSSAGALGLMQLMPGTARETASQAGLSFAEGELMQPDVNIALGSRYLARMLEQFGGNRILAAAAYNAGPNRVRQWLARGNGDLPFDIWIETIPFAETRGYVQNVLAYAVIYGYRMGAEVSLISDLEASTRL